MRVSDIVPPGRNSSPCRTGWGHRAWGSPGLICFSRIGGGSSSGNLSASKPKAYARPKSDKNLHHLKKNGKTRSLYNPYYPKELDRNNQHIHSPKLRPFCHQLAPRLFPSRPCPLGFRVSGLGFASERKSVNSGFVRS